MLLGVWGVAHTTLPRAGQAVSYPVLMRLVVNRRPIPRPGRGHRIALAAALAACAALVLSACSASTGPGNGTTATSTSPTSSATSPSTDPTTSTPSASPSTAAADAAPVHVSLSSALSTCPHAPVTAAQRWQVRLQAALQHTPSVQLPEEHSRQPATRQSAVRLQVCPSGRCVWHCPSALQYALAAQLASLVQLVPHVELDPVHW